MTWIEKDFDSFLFGMSQSWKDYVDEPEDKEEYIEVKEPQHIQAILRAEQEGKAKAQEESIFKIIDQAPSPKTNNPSDRKFIQDDRERIYPQQQTNQTTQPSQPPSKNKKQDTHKDKQPKQNDRNPQQNTNNQEKQTTKGGPAKQAPKNNKN